MSNDPGQGSWSSICTDHLTAFSLKHLLLLLRTSFHLKSLDELAVFRRNHLPPGKREWGFCSVRAEGSLWASDTECPPLSFLFEHWPPHPAPTDLSSGLTCTTSCSQASQDLSSLTHKMGTRTTLSLRGWIEDETIQFHEVVSIGLVHRSSIKYHLWARAKSLPAPPPPKPTQQVSGSSPFHDSQPSWAILTILPPDFTLLPPSLPLRQLSTMATAQWASCFQLHPSPRPSDPAVLSSTHLTALLLSPGQTINLKGSST